MKGSDPVLGGLSFMVGVNSFMIHTADLLNLIMSESGAERQLVIESLLTRLY